MIEEPILMGTFPESRFTEHMFLRVHRSAEGVWSYQEQELTFRSDFPKQEPWLVLNDSKKTIQILGDTYTYDEVRSMLRSLKERSK